MHKIKPASANLLTRLWFCATIIPTIVKRELVFIKLNWNKKYTTIAMYSFIVIAAAILFVVFVFKYESISSGFSWVGEVLAPILIGIVTAYIINPLVVVFDDKVFIKLREREVKLDSHTKNYKQRFEKSKNRRKNIARALSIICSFILVLALLAGISIAIVPNVAKSIVDIAENMPKYVEKVDAFLHSTFENNPELANLLSEEFGELSGIVKKVGELVEPMAIAAGVTSVVSGLITVLKNVVIGIIISVYLLCSKERLMAQMRKVGFALFKNGKCQSFFTTCGRVHRIFTQYIISNLLDCTIVFSVMAIGMTIMDMPYALLVSAVCAVTDLIPFFGPFIGAIPCGFIILLIDPIKVIWFAIFVLAFQQIDGNIIRPFLLKETMGLPATWALIAIIAGGGLFGIPGMLLGVPVFTVIYMLFSEFLAGRLKKKNLPTGTDSYYEVSEYVEGYGSGEDENPDSSE